MINLLQKSQSLEMSQGRRWDVENWCEWLINFPNIEKKCFKKPKGQTLKTAGKAKKHEYNFFFNEVSKIVHHEHN